jgi:hypothetical protein
MFHATGAPAPSQTASYHSVRAWLLAGRPSNAAVRRGSKHAGKLRRFIVDQRRAN